VIPCHDNAFSLSIVLRALGRQTLQPQQIIVVDDHSSAPESLQLRRLCRLHAADYERLPPPRTPAERLGRRSHARNAGTRRLRTDLVLYLDGDMLPSPGYVDELHLHHGRRGWIYVRGTRHGPAPPAHD